MKKKYTIPCSWEVYATAVVEAESQDEAISIAEDHNFPLPTDSDYICGSFRIDKELVEHEKDE